MFFITHDNEYVVNISTVNASWSLLFQQPYNIRKQVRNIETNEKKLIQAKMAVVFNNTCIN